MRRPNGGDEEIRRLLRKLAEGPTVEDAKRLVTVLERRGMHESAQETAKTKRAEKERTLQKARAIIQRDYWEDVTGIVDSIKDAIRSGEIDEEDQFRDRVSEEVDGSGRVIYTQQAQEGLVVSQNDTAYFDAMGSGDGAVSDSGIEWSRLMYHALEADVMEELGDYDSLVEELRPDSEEEAE